MEVERRRRRKEEEKDEEGTKEEITSSSGSDTRVEPDGKLKSPFGHGETCSIDSSAIR